MDSKIFNNVDVVYNEGKMKKYSIIYADPPWDSFVSMRKRDGSRKLMDDHYVRMTTQEIASLPVENLAEDNSVLFVWVLDSMLQEGLDVIRRWGFNYSTIAFHWIKKGKNGNQIKMMAPWTLKGAEICLMATKGRTKNLLKNRAVSQIVESQRRKHSEKPDEVRKNIEIMFGNIPRIELFARTKTEGWDVWGNEVESDIDLLITP